MIATTTFHLSVHDKSPGQRLAPGSTDYIAELRNPLALDALLAIGRVLQAYSI